MLKERPLRYFERIAQSSLLRLASAFDMGPCARLLADESGQDMIEYALAAVLLGLVVAVAAWRIRQVMAAGREPRVAPGAALAEADAEAEWGRAIAAAERGDFRAAIRYAFRSALVSLVQRGRLPVQPAWTTPELLSHARGDPELSARLGPAAAGFDRAWYSEAPVDADRWEELRGECQAIRALTGRGRPPA